MATVEGQAAKKTLEKGAWIGVRGEAHAAALSSTESSLGRCVRLSVGSLAERCILGNWLAKFSKDASICGNKGRSSRLNLMQSEINFLNIFGVSERT